MEFGPREVLIVLGALLVCGIVLDGVRRMRAARQGALRGPRRQPIFDDDVSSDEPLINGELPSGGARVVGVRDDDAVAEVGKQLWRSPEAGKRTTPFLERSRLGSGQAAEPIQSIDEEPREAVGAEVGDPETAERNTIDHEANGRGAICQNICQDMAPEDPKAGAADADSPPPSTEQVGVDAPTTSPPLVAERVTEDDLPLFRGEPAPPPQVSPRRGSRKSGRALNGGGKPAADGAEPIQAVVLHLMAPGGGAFAARPLFEALQKVGLEFGERHIFHRFAASDAEPRAPLFSVANAVKPGTFEGTLGEFRTPGVAFFMVIGDTPEPLAAFDDMLTTAREVAAALGADLCDEQRSALTRQVIADYRQRVAEGARRHAAGLTGGR